jgi:hypothetical protein
MRRWPDEAAGMDRRTALRVLGAMAVGLAAPSLAADAREITWLALVPKDWNPRARLGKFNVEGLEDSDPRAQQYMRELREILDTAPTVTELDGTLIKMPGYVVPLEQTKDGLKEFLLVPYYGACVHTPPPPANQIVHVQSGKAVKGFESMAAVWVTGTLKALRRDSGLGVSGYRLDLAKMEVYR